MSTTPATESPAGERRLGDPRVGEATFTRLPRIGEVGRADVAILGVPRPPASSHSAPSTSPTPATPA